MQNANHNYSDINNIIKTSCWIFSLLGWLLYLICGWISLKWIGYETIPNYGTYGYLFTIYRLPIYKDISTNKKYAIIYPLQLQASVLYIIVIITMLFALIAFIVYLVKTSCKQEKAVFDGMMNDWTRFHFVPLFLAAGLFLIGICLAERKDGNWEDANIAGIILDILGLGSLIFIYIKTDLPDDCLTASIKKGAYSSLIALEWYYFCYIIYNLAAMDKPNKTLESKEDCGVIMPIIEGLGVLFFSFYFNDVVIAFMNVLIFAGAMGYYFSIDKTLRKKDAKQGGHGAGEGVIDLIFFIFSVVVVFFLIIVKKRECLK